MLALRRGRLLELTCFVASRPVCVAAPTRNQPFSTSSPLSHFQCRNSNVSYRNYSLLNNVARLSAARFTPTSVSAAQSLIHNPVSRRQFGSLVTRISKILRDPNTTTNSSSTTAVSHNTAFHFNMPSHGHSPLSVDYSKDTLHAVELDETGLAMERDLGKAELARRFDLHPRDVRFLDSSSRNLPSILARRQVILVNLPGFKSIVSADSVVIFDSFLPHVQGVLPYLRAGLNPHADPSTGEYQGYSSVSLGGTARMPYEFIALEYILMTVTRNLEERFEAYVHQLVNVLGDVDKNIGEGATLMHLLQLKNGLTSFEVVLRETATAIKEVLQSDEDMAEMYLTDKKANRTRETSHHEEMEVLLETYLRKVDELENEVSTHLKSITLTENHIQIRLDTIRNAMMRVELLIALGTFGVATGALGASFFGMNIRSGFESLPEPYTFWATAGVFTLLAFGAVRAGVRYCAGRKIDLFHVDHEPRLSLPLFSKKKRYIAPPTGGSFSTSAMPLSSADAKPPPLPGKQKGKQPTAAPVEEENNKCC